MSLPEEASSPRKNKDRGKNSSSDSWDRVMSSATDGEPSFRPILSPSAASIVNRDTIGDRAQKFQEERDRKIRELERQLEAQRLKEVTLSPKINDYELKAYRGRDVFKNQWADLENRQNRYQALTDQVNADETVTFRPQITAYSQSLAREEPVYDRLYSLSKEREEKEEMLMIDSQRDPDTGRPYFQPLINQVPCVRDERVEESLYKDAEHRRLRRNVLIEILGSEDRMNRDSRKMNFKSLKLARERLTKQLIAAFRESTCPDTPNASSPSGENFSFDSENTMGYSELDKALKMLGVFPQSAGAERRDDEQVALMEKLWQIMDCDNTNQVSMEVFVRIMSVILDPISFGVASENESDVNSSATQSSSKLAREFRRLRMNFLAFGSRATALMRSEERPQSAPTAEFTFRPVINAKSRAMDARQSGTGSGVGASNVERRYEHITQALKKKEEFIRTEQERLIQQEMEECKFKPQINTTSKVTKAISQQQHYQDPELLFDRLYRSSKNRPGSAPPSSFSGGSDSAAVVSPNGAKTSMDKEVEQHCTFRPDTSLTKQSIRLIKKQPRSVPRGYQEAVERLRASQKEREQSQREEEEREKRRLANVYKKKTSEGLTKVQPFRFELDKRHRNRTILFMDVNLGPGRTGRIGIREGDDPRKLAENFAVSYKLDDILTDRLEELLRYHIEQLVGSGALSGAGLSDRGDYGDRNNSSGGPDGIMDGLDEGDSGEYSGGFDSSSDDRRRLRSSNSTGSLNGIGRGIGVGNSSSSLQDAYFAGESNPYEAGLSDPRFAVGGGGGVHSVSPMGTERMLQYSGVYDANGNPVGDGGGIESAGGDVRRAPPRNDRDFAEDVEHQFRAGYLEEDFAHRDQPYPYSDAGAEEFSVGRPASSSSVPFTAYP